MHIIYADVLLVTSLFMDYILLQLTAGLTHTRLSFSRALLGAAVGSAASLLILLPPMPLLLSLLCKIGSSTLLCIAAFGCKDGQRLFWHCLSFLGMSCMTAGILLALSLMGARIWYANGSWYPDISLRQLVLFTVIAYLLLTVIQRLRDRTTAADGSYHVTIRKGDAVIVLDGMADTGNSLTDFYTGKPVIICGRAQLSPLLPKELPPEKYRPLPCSTVAGDGVVLCFAPDEVLISTDRIKKPVDVLIGFTEHDTKQAVFNPKLLRY
ncbi:MAG: sigma-E processing peptidase SpoIIGA [Oscillospiraceae bacterium]|nr:sigma-E processing peptidase SpoIIGA [Oscillospiraceae bacterium]